MFFLILFFTFCLYWFLNIILQNFNSKINNKSHLKFGDHFDECPPHSWYYTETNNLKCTKCRYIAGSDI